jgi:GTP-binding protein HflX
MTRLTDAIEARIARSRPVYRLVLAPGDGKSLAWLHANGEILARSDGEDGALSLLVRLPPEREGAFAARFPEAEPER